MNEETKKTRWVFDGDVLVVDDDDTFRQGICLQLRHAGCAGCHAAGSYEEAVAVLQEQPNIKVAIVDHPMGGGNLIESLKTLHSDVTIIGNSGGDRRVEFAAAGVTKYLQKPWRIEQLVDLLRGRIVECVDCGLPLPLRHPRPEETGSSWVCAYCGSRYRAVLDDQCPPDTLANVLSGIG